MYVVYVEFANIYIKIIFLLKLIKTKTSLILVKSAYTAYTKTEKRLKYKDFYDV